MLNGSGVLVIK
jgi:ectoine hydroxylase-related dioxygenase (phytanoyl-CoA dioxygenase family)